jgi:hypothetical protein
MERSKYLQARECERTEELKGQDVDGAFIDDGWIDLIHK